MVYPSRTRFRSKIEAFLKWRGNWSFGPSKLFRNFPQIYSPNFPQVFWNNKALHLLHGLRWGCIDGETGGRIQFRPDVAGASEHTRGRWSPLRPVRVLWRGDFCSWNMTFNSHWLKSGFRNFYPDLAYVKKSKGKICLGYGCLEKVQVALKTTKKHLPNQKSKTTWPVVNHNQPIWNIWVN